MSIELIPQGKAPFTAPVLLTLDTSAPSHVPRISWNHYFLF